MKPGNGRGNAGKYEYATDRTKDTSELIVLDLAIEPSTDAGYDREEYK